MRLNMSRSASVRKIVDSSSSGQSVNADGLRIVVGKLLLRELDSVAFVDFGMMDVESDSTGRKNFGTRLMSLTRSRAKRATLFVCLFGVVRVALHYGLDLHFSRL
jgi:hypothetical protein